MFFKQALRAYPSKGTAPHFRQQRGQMLQMFQRGFPRVPVVVAVFQHKLKVAGQRAEHGGRAAPERFRQKGAAAQGQSAFRLDAGQAIPQQRERTGILLRKTARGVPE